MGAGHDHGLGEVQHEKPLWWAFGLTAAFLVAEVVGGLVTNSLALLSDAAHMATEGCGTARCIRTHRILRHRVSDTSCGRPARA